MKKHQKPRINDPPQFKEIRKPFWDKIVYCSQRHKFFGSNWEMYQAKEENVGLDYGEIGHKPQNSYPQVVMLHTFIGTAVAPKPFVRSIWEFPHIFIA